MHKRTEKKSNKLEGNEAILILSFLTVTSMRRKKDPRWNHDVWAGSCTGWRGRLDAEDAKISEPEGAAVETVQNETERKRTPKRKQDHHPDVGETGVPEGRGGRA